MNELKLNNKLIKVLKTSELINDFHIVIPEIQRIIEINKVNDIVMYQLGELKKKKICQNMADVIMRKKRL